MQFPNPIARYLIISDANGNTVIAIGPGPSIVIKGTTPSGDIELTQSAGTAQIRFWNQPHTDYGSILAHDVTDGVTNNIVSMIYQGSVRTSIIPPGNPLVHTGMIQDSYLGLPGTWIGNIIASGQAIGAVLGVEDTIVEMQFIDSTGTLKGSIDFNQNQIGYQSSVNPSDTLHFDWTIGWGVWAFDVVGVWTNLTLFNGWTPKAGYMRPAVRLTPLGTVEFRGTMTGGTIADNTRIATLPTFPAGAFVHPAGFALMRPAIAPTGAGTASARIFVTGSDLFVYGINAGGTTDISLDGLSFSNLP